MLAISMETASLLFLVTFQIKSLRCPEFATQDISIIVKILFSIVRLALNTSTHPTTAKFKITLHPDLIFYSRPSS